MKIRYLEISTTVTHLLLIQVKAEVQETKVWFEFTKMINQETFFPSVKRNTTQRQSAKGNTTNRRNRVRTGEGKYIKSSWKALKRSAETTSASRATATQFNLFTFGQRKKEFGYKKSFIEKKAKENLSRNDNQSRALGPRGAESFMKAPVFSETQKTSFKLLLINFLMLFNS